MCFFHSKMSKIIRWPFSQMAIMWWSISVACFSRECRSIGCDPLAPQLILRFHIQYINVYKAQHEKKTWFILMFCVKDVALYMIHTDIHKFIYIVCCVWCMVDHAVRFMAWTMNCPGASFSAHSWSAGPRGPRAQRPTAVVAQGHHERWLIGQHLSEDSWIRGQKA